MLAQLSAPATEPLSIAEVKAHLRVDFSDDDALITALIVTARQQAEHRTGRALVSQQWRLGLEFFPDNSLELPKPKLLSVESITYLDGDGVRQTISAADYEVITDELVGRVVPAYGKTWPSSIRSRPGCVQVSYTCGYGAAADVPQSIKSWMLLAIGAWYENREALVSGQPVAELPRCFWNGLLDPFYVPGV